MEMFSSGAPRQSAQFPLAAAVLLVCLLTGCTRYPEVTSPESLLLLSAARTACSSQNPERLERVRQRVEELREESKLSPVEYEAFGRILEMAERGDWEAAEKACFHYQKAQLR
jgi:hypothetical protein